MKTQVVVIGNSSDNQLWLDRLITRFGKTEKSTIFEPILVDPKPKQTWQERRAPNLYKRKRKQQR